ncbi:MAG: helix-turn-helix transcriptional regulator [Ruminococcaceae bacterium]|nr:helix-turn-helix transcriptional regulator [Oscillospiraceae bacterium]
MDKKEIGTRLAALRGDISRETLAKDLGISVSAIQMYETGERVPRDEIKIKIAKYFNRSVQSIFFENINHET